MKPLIGQLVVRAYWRFRCELLDLPYIFGDQIAIFCEMEDVTAIRSRCEDAMDSV